MNEFCKCNFCLRFNGGTCLADMHECVYSDYFDFQANKEKLIEVAKEKSISICDLVTLINLY